MTIPAPSAKFGEHQPPSGIAGEEKAKRSREGEGARGGGVRERRWAGSLGLVTRTPARMVSVRDIRAESAAGRLCAGVSHGSRGNVMSSIMLDAALEGAVLYKCNCYRDWCVPEPPEA